MASFGYVKHQNELDLGNRNLTTDAHQIYLLTVLHGDRQETSLAAILAGRQLDASTPGYSPKSTSCTPAINGNQSQRRWTNPDWDNLGPATVGSNVIVAAVVGVPASDLAVVHFELATPIALSGGPFSLTIQNSDHLVNVL